MINWLFYYILNVRLVICDDNTAVDCKKVVFLFHLVSENIYLYIYIFDAFPAGVGDSAAPDCGQCWMLLVILCPSSALLLSLLSSLVVYLRCRRKGSVYISVNCHLLHLENTYATYCLP